MTDPGLADATYVEPITPEIVEKIIAREKPDALLPTMGGQTALNTAMKLAANGALARHGVELIGARAEVIDRAEDRLKFRDAMAEIGIESPRSAIAHSMDEARAALADDRAAGRHPAAASRSAAPAAASRITARSSSRSSPAGWMRRRPTRC